MLFDAASRFRLDRRDAADFGAAKRPSAGRPVRGKTAMLSCSGRN